MAVRTICSRDVHTLAGTASVREAAMRMLEHHVGTLVVVDGRKLPMGVVTDRDIVTRCIAREFDPGTTPASEIMTAPVETVRDDASVETALERMAEAEVRRLVVTDQAGRMVGLLALDDALGFLVRQATEIGEVLSSQLPV